MSQHIKLKIDNHVPHLFFVGNDGSEKKLTNENEDISKILLNIGENLNLIEDNMDDDVQVERLLSLSNEAADDYINENPDIDTESLEFELGEIMDRMILDTKNIEPKYSDIDDLQPELQKDLAKNQNLDILGGLLDTIYKIIIAKTLLAAYELEINNIHFSSLHNYPRFIEKLGYELQKLGLELVIENE